MVLQYISENECTLLGVGLVSKCSVDAVIEMLQEYDISMILMASRNQTDSDELGGGYANIWTNQIFSSFVREKDISGNIYILPESMEYAGRIKVKRRMD